MKTKYRLILLKVMSACILCIGAWMLIYFMSKPITTQQHSAESDSNAPAAPKGYNSSPKDSFTISDDASQKTHQSESYLAVPKELKHLRVVGTAVNSENKPCAVIYNIKTQAQGLYMEGEEINGARIAQIQRDYVIAELNNKRIKLILEKSSTSGPQLNADDLLQDTPKTFIYTTQDDVEKAWNETQDLMTKIEVEQHFDNGEPKGVRIEKVLPDSVFEKIGLKSGDILIRVDDMEMTIADDAMEIYNCIRTKPFIEFTVIRDGQPDPLILEYHQDMQTN